LRLGAAVYINAAAGILHKKLGVPIRFGGGDHTRTSTGILADACSAESASTSDALVNVPWRKPPPANAHQKNTTAEATTQCRGLSLPYRFDRHGCCWDRFNQILKYFGGSAHPSKEGWLMPGETDIVFMNQPVQT